MAQVSSIRELIYTGRISEQPLHFDGFHLRNLWAILRVWPETEKQLEWEAKENATWVTPENVVLAILDVVQDARSREREALANALRAVQDKRAEAEEKAGAPWREVEDILENVLHGGEE